VTAEPTPIRRARAESVYTGRFGTLFDDHVIAPAGTAGRHLRWRWPCHGVVAVACHGDRIAFVPAYRYAIGGVSLELPRGGVEPEERPEPAACRELAEEAGVVGTAAETIGTLYSETALIENPLTVVRVAVEAPGTDGARPEEMESFGAPVWLDRAGVAAAVADGRIRCGVTLAALALHWLST
jgi:8-oxo-dGTP pyrophosphatase MutT (NUDIX family)